MKANYSVRALPLGAVARTAAAVTFETKLLCQLTLDGNPQPVELQAAIERHPVLSLPANVSLHGTVRRYADWQAGRRGNDAILGRCVLSTADPLPQRRRALAELVGLGYVRPSVQHLVHSKDFDMLKREDFVDVTAAMDEVRKLTLGLHSFVRAGLKSAAPRAQNVPASAAEFERAKWIGNCVQSTVLDLVAGRRDAAALLMESQVLSKTMSQVIAAAGEKIEKRSRGRGTVTAAATPSAPEANDLNALLQSSLKSELISRLCGFVTTWHAACDAPLPEEEVLVLELDALPVASDATVMIESTLPTAFFCASHAHPAAFRDLKAGRRRQTGFAWLSDDDVAPTLARYRATSISAEHQFTKQILVQSSNSLGRPTSTQRNPTAFFSDLVDTRGPDQLRQEAYSIPDAETSGVTFSAPVEDLVTPDELKADSPEERMRKLPCLFLEDLWVGYRLDLRRRNMGRFGSTHLIHQTVRLHSGEVISGDSEDQFDREQAQDPKYEYSSTDLKVYRGLSDPQSRDYLLAAGLAAEELTVAQNAFYSSSVQATAAATPLEFGEEYDYRLRLVFAGGCSLRADDNSAGARYTQTFPFYRCASLQAGELWIAPQQRAGNGGVPETLYVTAGNPRVEFALMPKHLDLESARFHGLLFRDRAEPTRLAGRRIIKDFSRAFPSAPVAVDYFCDPDVHGVVVTARILNGAEPAPAVGSDTVDGASCSLVVHQFLGPLTALYGEPGAWDSFRPIWFSIVAREGQPPSLETKGLFRGCRHVELCLPGAVQAELSFVPLYTPGLEWRHATNVGSSSQILSGSRAEPMLVPTVATLTLRATHAIGTCRHPPELETLDRGGSRPRSPDAPSPCRRSVARPNVATLPANVAVDAASSKQMWCEATWSDILDSSALGSAFRMRPGKASSPGINLIFKRKEPPTPSSEGLLKALDDPGSTMSVFDLQVIQSRVFLGQEARPAGARVDELDLPDERRRLMEVRCVTSPRFGEVPGVVSAAPVASSPKWFDAPSAMRMTSLQAAYAVPMKRPVRNGNRHLAAFGMRVYLHADMFESGVAERVAIGCWPEATGAGGPLLEVPKYVTQWGEDPLARAQLAVTTRMPRASDFVLLQDDSKIAERLDRSLYPPHIVGGAGGVIYRDSVALPRLGSAIPRLSLASFAVRFDARQRLWYFDFAVEAEFFGWCGLALYRHQPHALEGFELSATAAWIYACTLYEEPFTVTRIGAALRVVVGPVYDKSVSFAMDATEFVNGVSTNLAVADVPLTNLNQRRIGNAWYFESQVPASTSNVSLVKLRGGHPVQSRPVVVRGEQS